VLLLFGVKKIYNWSLTVDVSFIIHLYFVEIEPGSTNMRTRAGEKVGGVLIPGPHRDWRHWSSVTFISWLKTVRLTKKLWSSKQEMAY